MDLQMPGADGLDAIRRLRGLETTRDIPILAVTALALPGDRERCYAAGANGYVTKPLDLPALVVTIQRLVGAAAPDPG
jgi:CheY-like chemotaxis protein